MFDKLIDIIVNQLTNLLPFYVVEEWYAVIHLRFGKYYKESRKGIHFKIPFVDNVDTKTLITYKTREMKPQSINDMIARGVVRYRVVDPTKYFLTLAGWDEIVEDTIYQCIFECRPEFNTEDIKQRSNEILNKWGIEIDNVTLSDYGKIRTYRLMSDNNLLNKD